MHKKFDLSKIENETNDERMVVSFWVTRSKKDKFDKLQEKSKKKFGKHLIEVIEHEIAKVEMTDEAS